MITNTFLQLINGREYAVQAEVAERVKEQEFEAGFLHGWDGSECIYYTDEKCLYYNDAEAPCHHCHHYTRKTQRKGE